MNSDDNSDKTTVLSAEQMTIKKDREEAKDQAACLIIIRGTPQGHRFFINQDGMTIGRDPTADITVNDPSISRRHAKFTLLPGKVVQITDLGSSNKTLVNDKQVLPNQTVSLAKEDMVKLGNSVFKFLPAGEVEILYYGNLGSAVHTDALTQIYNKGYLIEALEAEFKRAKALKTDLSVIFMDLDFFKKINDTYGHDAGDYVLKEFSNLIRVGHLRPKDIFARYGGEEFCVVLGSLNAVGTQPIAERMRAAIEAHAFVYEGKRLPVTSSMGVAQMSPTMESSTSLLKAADKALYAAKQSGRNRVVLSE